MGCAAPAAAPAGRGCACWIHSVAKCSRCSNSASSAADTCTTSHDSSRCGTLHPGHMVCGAADTWHRLRNHWGASRETGIVHNACKPRAGSSGMPAHPLLLQHHVAIWPLLSRKCASMLLQQMLQHEARYQKCHGPWPGPACVCALRGAGEWGQHLGCAAGPEGAPHYEGTRSRS